MKSLIFTGEMVRSILDDRKTQTRRVIKPQPINGKSFGSAGGMAAIAPLQDGETIYVRETWAPIPGMPAVLGNIMFRASKRGGGWQWRSPLHMRAEHARLFLRIESVRVERLRDITEEDAKAEGIDHDGIAGYYCDEGDPEDPDDFGTHRCNYRFAFSCLWNSLHGPGSWDANPFVWVYTFRRVEK